MNLNSNFTSPLTPHRNLPILHRRTFQVREHRLWRRRRLKTKPNSVLRSELGPSPFENLFQNLVSQFPSINSLDLLAPALGFASGVALYLSRLNSAPNSKFSDVGEWILFTSPTPFNRFVMLRCPSVSFEGSELLEDVNERLVEEDRHFVRLSNGRIQVRGGDEAAEVEKLVYQRVCVSTDDGGVVSLDWPANLDLTEEHGLDTTLLLIPGTAEGSMEVSVRLFVCESLKRGFFPVVMNPRGCAGSPLTTARLFTAADSDDICTAIQFINKARPWTTLMGVGWGYGANMLTKYLAESGERTPLTAATCIDNPFDLEEATRSSPQHIVLDQKLTGGLIDILRSNKELFRGRAKGFDVEKALIAKSVRDFEKAISMVSYGFEAIEDFYAKSSTRGLVGNVKVPVLFIQNDDGTVPLFSIPRSLIAENPFTSLLLCSCSCPSIIARGRSAISWYQHLTIEWLAAVELGLLKGRHPLLKDVDVTLNPSKGFARVDDRAFNRSGRANKLPNISHSNVLNGYATHSLEDTLRDRDSSASISSRFRRDSLKNSEIEDTGFLQQSNGTLGKTSSVDADLAKEEVSPIDNERGQVLPTAQVVMNMLDVTMPGTLTEEQKKKVLTAVGQGETVMKALEDAVPEDVRGKLKTAVSGILHNQGPLNISQIPDVASGLKSKIQEKVGGLPSAGGYEDPHSLDPRHRVDDMPDKDNLVSADNPAGVMDSELQASEALQNANDIGLYQSTAQGGDITSSMKKDTIEYDKNNENVGLFRERAAQNSDHNENGSNTGAKPDFPSQPEMINNVEDINVDQHKVDQNGGLAKLDVKEEDIIQQNIEKVSNSSTDQNKTVSSTKTEEGLPQPVSSYDAQPMEKETNEYEKREEKDMHSVLNLNSSDSPTFSVSNALDALTGMDDSTQVAVNSVFGVIEDMITQMEEEKVNDTNVDEKKEVEDRGVGSISENNLVVSDHNSTRKENKHDMKSHDGRNSHNDATTRWAEERPIRSPDILKRNDIACSSENDMVRHNEEENGKREHLVSSKLLANHSNQVRHLYDVPLYITTSPFGDPLYKEYLRKYLLSKMSNSKSLDLDTTTELFLDYFPEEGQWKLLEQPENNEDSSCDVATHEGSNKDIQVHSPSKAATDKVIEPTYIIMDDEKEQEPVQEYGTVDITNQKVVISNEISKKLMSCIKKIMLDSLKVEVGRRLSAANTKEIEPNLARDMEKVANAVSLAARHSKDHIWFLDGKDCNSEKLGTLNGEHIIKSISFSIQETNYLRRVLPVGVVVGSSLAALRKFFNVAMVNGGDQIEAMALDKINDSVERNHVQLFETEADQVLHNKVDSKYDVSGNRDGENAELEKLNNDTVMVRAVTAALGASALLVHQQGMKNSDNGNEISKKLSKSFEEEGNYQKGADKLVEEISENSPSNMVTSLAEKAMSIAGPVVPMREDGEVDQDRLVAMLTGLGQKGGMLKLVGKIALLWGGMRGAMSLTDKLISFLRIADRPLPQRILAFVCMVLVLWSPVVIPLLPTLVQSWATHNSSKMAQLVCIVGLYVSIVTLIMLWGKRIRGYENPFEQYGLDFTELSQILNFLKGLVGGVVLVLSIHYLNVLLGCVRLSWPSTFVSHSSDNVKLLKAFGKMVLLVGQGIVTATGAALVEELLFRSWLPDEIATDFGYYRGIIISGLAFSISQRSPWAIPGLWLLSLGLAGARQRSQGSLSIPIGLRSGIMASSFVLQMGGFLSYQPNFPLWVTGTHLFQPFSGVTGLAFTLLLAVVLYPKQPLQHPKNTRTIQE